ncbi:MAG: hypothetical protein NT088_03285 [Candidatus Omnitrophica bacterium]|nr:hypothetical protein [Candidatus Omnitrophota bacterium]
MGFYLVGLDHQRADIALREESYKKRKDIFFSLGVIFRETALLSTCNRIEIYGAGKKVSAFPKIPQGWHFISGNAEVFRHALRLASGLESQLRGETQILGQLNAWISNLPAGLSAIWERAYSEALNIREQAGLNMDFNNVASFLYKDIEKYVPENGNLKAIVVGTGKIAELLAKDKPGNIELFFVSRKNRGRALELAASSQSNTISFEDLTQGLDSVDILISATASPHYILRKDQLNQIVLKREKPLYIYDLAVPRDIEPQAKDINGIILKNLDDLTVYFEAHNKSMQEKLCLAGYLVEERVKIYEKSIETGEPAESVSLTSGR